MYFIDDFSRIAFTGDCCNYNNGTRLAASTFIRDLKRLLDGYGKTYDRIFTGHTTYCGTLDVKSHDITVVRYLIEAFRSLLRGDAVLGERHMQLFPERPPHQGRALWPRRAVPSREQQRSDGLPVLQPGYALGGRRGAHHSVTADRW